MRQRKEVTTPSFKCSANLILKLLLRHSVNIKRFSNESAQTNNESLIVCINVEFQV